MAKESLSKYFKRNLSNPLLWVHWVVLAYALTWFINNFTNGSAELSFPIGWAAFIIFFAFLDLATEKVLRV